MKEIILHSTTKEEFVDLMRAVIQSELASFKPHQENNTTTFYTRKDVAKMLNISLPTLSEWTKDGIITAHRIGSRVRYKYEDIQQALKEINTLKFSRRK